MRFLSDQDVYALTVNFLRGLAHDVETASQVGMAQAGDAALLDFAHQQARIFITRDRDFGALVFVQGNGPGVIYLRILPSTQDAVHAELARVLTLYNERDLLRSSLSNQAVIESERSDHPRRLECDGTNPRLSAVFRRGAAEECSPWRQPWGNMQQMTKPRRGVSSCDLLAAEDIHLMTMP